MKIFLRTAAGALLCAAVTVGCGEEKKSPAEVPARVLSRALRMDSLNNLKQIGTAVQLFRIGRNEKFPASPEEIAEEIGQSCFIAKFDRQTAPGGTSYAYIGNIGRVSRDLARIPLAFEKPHLLPADQSDLAVLYADGQVKIVPIQEVSRKSVRQVTELLTADLPDAALKNRLLQNADAVQ